MLRTSPNISISSCVPSAQVPPISFRSNHFTLTTEVLNLLNIYHTGQLKGPMPDLYGGHLKGYCRILLNITLPLSFPNDLPSPRPPLQPMTRPSSPSFPPLLLTAYHFPQSFLTHLYPSQHNYLSSNTHRSSSCPHHPLTMTFLNTVKDVNKGDRV